jgi:hypothetical protein
VVLELCTVATGNCAVVDVEKHLSGSENRENFAYCWAPLFNLVD